MRCAFRNVIRLINCGIIDLELDTYRNGDGPFGNGGRLNEY